MKVYKSLLLKVHLPIAFNRFVTVGFCSSQRYAAPKMTMLTGLLEKQAVAKMEVKKSSEIGVTDRG